MDQKFTVHYYSTTSLQFIFNITILQNDEVSEEIVIIC